MTVVTVPDLFYKDQNTAEKLLKQAGLTPEYIGEDYSDEYPEGQVFYQSVSAGTQVEKEQLFSIWSAKDLNHQPRIVEIPEMIPGQKRTRINDNREQVYAGKDNKRDCRILLRECSRIRNFECKARVLFEKTGSSRWSVMML